MGKHWILNDLSLFSCSRLFDPAEKLHLLFNVHCVEKGVTRVGYKSEFVGKRSKVHLLKPVLIIKRRTDDFLVKETAIQCSNRMLSLTYSFHLYKYSHLQ